MLADFGLADLGLANPFRLSHGEKRRLSVATMLILGQKLLILDEPTIGQDLARSEALFSILEELCRELGSTMVLVICR